MDKLYCVLITTKTSNILEDLETLRYQSKHNFRFSISMFYRLFVRVINEYTGSQTKGSSDEQAIMENAFTLLFAFDEIVALGEIWNVLDDSELIVVCVLGYRESVNMTQVRTFIEMDSHEERVFVAVRQTQEREAKQKMREKAKELSKLQKTQQNERLKAMNSSMNVSLNNAIDLKPEPTMAERAPPISSNVRPKVIVWPDLPLTQSHRMDFRALLKHLNWDRVPDKRCSPRPLKNNWCLS